MTQQPPEQPSPFDPPPKGAPPPGYGQQPGYAPPPGYPPPGYPPPGYPPPGYPPPAYGQQPGWAPYPPRSTNVLAIVSLVLIFVFTPAALVTGLIARSQIRKTGEAGDGMALAGIICGGLSILLVVGLFVLFVLFAFAATDGVGEIFQSPLPTPPG